MTQQIRLSQFVITYGPGAILEGSRGPRVIPLSDIGLFAPQSGRHPEDFEISDQRMSQGLLDGARIFRIPSNAELGLSDQYYVYRTVPFPSWSLCLNTQQHQGLVSILYIANRCPVCRTLERRREEAIRFIRACSDGHMDDVDWHYLVHRNARCGHSGYLLWYGGGGALSQVRIECPRCHLNVNLGWAYGQSWPCSGRFPEAEPPRSSPHRPGCSQPSRLIQRQASNLRIPELRTLFTIPPRYTRLHRLLELMPVRSAIAAIGPGAITSKEALGNVLLNLEGQGLLSVATRNEVMIHSWEEIRSAIHDIFSPVSTSFEDLLLEEFGALANASVNGAPPIHGPPPISPVLFEVVPGNSRTLQASSGTKLRVTPVSRLRTVMVQTGYSRAIGNIQGSPVGVSFIDHQNPQQRWFPGVEFPGEGIFIMMDDNNGWHLPLAGGAAETWNTVFENPQGYRSQNFRSSLHDELHPVFVWWHTLAHLLVRAISVDAGYSSTAIRERIYFELDAQANRVRGGLIIYATQPGSEGTMGGLIALVPHFGHIIQIAIDMLRSCSNDPLCAENHFEAGEYSGPACYACVLVSETSCEHRNLWLDRELLMNNLP